MDLYWGWLYWGWLYWGWDHEHHEPMFFIYQPLLQDDVMMLIISQFSDCRFVDLEILCEMFSEGIPCWIPWEGGEISADSETPR